MEKVKVVKFQTYVFKGAFTRFAGDGVTEDGLSFFPVIKVLVPKEDGGPEYHPLEQNEAEAVATLSEVVPKIVGTTRRAHFKRAVLSLSDHGLRRFDGGNDLILYIGDGEPEVLDGPHPHEEVISMLFDQPFLDTEEIEVNTDTVAFTSALLLTALKDMSGRHSSGPARHEMDFNETTESAIVAKTTFANGMFGLVEEGGGDLNVYGQLRIMHEPGTKPEFHLLTDDEREGFSKMTDGKFVPVASYTFDNAGYLHHDSSEDQQELHLGRLPVMVDSEAAQVIEGFTWAPKLPFDNIGFTNYLGVKQGRPTKDEVEVVKSMTANSRYHEGTTATVN